MMSSFAVTFILLDPIGGLFSANLKYMDRLFIYIYVCV
jgi:hypothetical protein